MASGQVVLVTTEPLGGGAPVRSVFFVAEEDPARATAIIAAMMAPNERGWRVLKAGTYSRAASVTWRGNPLRNVTDVICSIDGYSLIE